jgi:Asp/Glu/hydantoin racemase
MNAPKIALIHATPLAMPAVKEAFSRLWPEARLMNLLDDSLSPDLVEAGEINASLTERFCDLALYAKRTSADGILYTCSAFGPAIDVARGVVGLPVLKPNEAMFEAALDVCAALRRPGRVGLVSTFAASVPSMRDELFRAAESRGLAVSLSVECPQGALEALGRGDARTHDLLVRAAANNLLSCDVLMLGQFSMAHLRGRIAEETSLAVLSSPDSAVHTLKQAILGQPAT